MKNRHIPSILVLAAPLLLFSCLKAERSPLDGSTPQGLFSWLILTGPVEPIKISAKNGHLNNANKSTPSPAVKLMAVTTRYETAGYTSEKVVLTPDGAGSWTGDLPVMDTKPRTVIVFDDVVIKPHPYGGTAVTGPGGGSGPHNLLITEGYFSPCEPGLAAGGTSIRNLVLYSNQTGPTPIAAPRLPPLGGGTSMTTSATDEIYIIISAVASNSEVNVDYNLFQRVDPLVFCACNKSFNYVVTNYSSASPTINFTDTNFDASGGACVVR